MFVSRAKLLIFSKQNQGLMRNFDIKRDLQKKSKICCVSKFLQKQFKFVDDSLNGLQQVEVLQKKSVYQIFLDLSAMQVFSFSIINCIQIQSIIQYFQKMFPTFGYTPFFNPFEVFSVQVSPQIDFNNVYIPFKNYYQMQPSPSDFRLIAPFGQFSQPIFLSSPPNEPFFVIPHQQLSQNQQKGIKNSNSSSTIDEKNIHSHKNKSKTKLISKNDKQTFKKQFVGQIQLKKQRLLKKQIESEYSGEEDHKKRSQDQIQLLLKYRRKNTESNIVNRIYSFLTSEFKNKKQVIRFGLNQQKKESYLKYLVLVVEAWKGPVKRQLLQKLLYIDESLPAYTSLIKLYESDQILSIEEFSYLNRVLIRTYLSKIAGVSIITSKKMKKGVWIQHLQKIRELNHFFFDSMENQN